MTASEFRKILDRFHLYFGEADMWASRNRVDLPTPGWYGGLDAVWRDLNRECALMRDAERGCVACELGVAGGLPSDDDVAVIPSATGENAKQIGLDTARNVV